MSKKALLVGLNAFPNPKWTLRGCVNDTLEMKTLLNSYFDFPEENIRLLHDQDATKQGIRLGLEWLLSDYDGSDVRVFHFSSHGSQVDDQNGDEYECRDEVIIPYDHSWDAPFRDDDLREIFDCVPPGVNFTFIADCCHSGTIQKVPEGIEGGRRYIDPPDEIQGRIQAAQQARDQAFEEYRGVQLERLLKDVPDAEWEAKQAQLEKLLLSRFRRQKYGVVAADKNYLLAGCKDDQTSADAFINGEYRGAFTWSLGQAIRAANGHLTYSTLIQRAATFLKGYTQTPQLECPTGMRRVKLFAPLS